jgi:hypothetical protein
MRQQKRFKEQDDIQTTKNHYKSVLQHKDSGLHNTGGDSMLIDLATHLDKTAPFAAVDPAFREALLDRLLNIQAQHSASEIAMITNNMTEIADEALQEWPFECLVHEIVDFPDEERTALLIDLANRPIRSETQPTRLEQAFLEVGIRLQDYQPLLPQDPIESREHHFFLNRAYKRVVELQEAVLS